MIMRCIAAFAFSLLTWSVCFASNVSVTDLSNYCSKKDIVMTNHNKQPERAYEMVGSFCSGYLQATLSLFLNSLKMQCSNVNSNEITPDILVSVFFEYLKSQKVEGSADAATTLIPAYQRAFDCHPVTEEAKKN
jgi:hypothetical protein